MSGRIIRGVVGAITMGATVGTIATIDIGAVEQKRALTGAGREKATRPVHVHC
jgi:hypothetical protein